MNRIVIGLTGKQGSGKNTFIQNVIKVFPHKSVDRITSGGILVDVLKILNIVITRHNLQELAKYLRIGFGDDIISSAVRLRIISSEADIVIFDGVRWQSDVDMVRSFPEGIIVYIQTDKEVRYQRLRNRGEKEDENNLSREEFEKAEVASTEVEIDNIGRRANFILANNGGEELFLEAIKNFCKCSNLSA